jgi:hypothetical protein
MQQYDCDAVREAILLVPTHQCKTLRMLATAIGIPKSTLHSMKQDKKDSVIVLHSNALKPHLQDHHKFARVLYSVANLDLDTEDYFSLFNSIHIDEKWGGLQKSNCTCTLCQVRCLHHEELVTRATAKCDFQSIEERAHD